MNDARWPSRRFGGLLCAALALGACDAPPTTQPEAVLLPLEIARRTAEFLNPVDAGAYSASTTLPTPSTNTGGALGSTGWVRLPSVSEPMYVYFRTSGTTRFATNPGADGTKCDIFCLDKIPPEGPGGEAGGAGRGGWLQ